MSTTSTTIREEEQPQLITLESLPSVIEAPLNYYLDNEDTADRLACLGTAKEKLAPKDVQKVKITDVRSFPEGTFNLDKNGFQYVKHQAVDPEIMNDQAKVEDVVYEDTKELMKRVTGASRVVPISHVVRRHDYARSIEIAKQSKPDEVVSSRSPAMFVHVDQSWDGAKQVLNDNLPSSLQDKLRHKCRWAIINIWRPFHHPVTREPLAVCSYTSVNTATKPTTTSTGRTIQEGGDLRAVGSVFPKGTQVSKGEAFELWNLTYNPNHEWYYRSIMRPDEALFIKCFDSKIDGRARLCPHTAFQSPFDQGPPRHSFEVRCMVFWEGEEEE